tara:strand:+ start:639 stop:1160 length:522 start_codon:yes stop_codon:yes gene_type:complete
MTVYKVDGIGTRKNGSGGETANFSEGNVKIIRLVGFAADSGGNVTYTKGDVVALQRAAATVDGSDVIGQYGIANVIKLAGAATELLCVGVVTETVTVAEGTTDIIAVQVAGVFENANVATASTAGLQIFPSGTAGRGAINASSDPDTNKPYAIALEDASSNAADIILLNPLDY